jgi:hypothetical protein
VLARRGSAARPQCAQASTGRRAFALTATPPGSRGFPHTAVRDVGVWSRCTPIQTAYREANEVI